MTQAPTLCLQGGEVLRPGGLTRQDLIVHNGHFAADEDSGTPLHVNLAGLWILPGIIDLHGDGFEHGLAPRRGLSTDLSKGLLNVETELACCGITTAWLAQFWSWEGGMRGPAFARNLASALQKIRPSLRLDLRLQLRLERTMVEDEAEILNLIQAHDIDYLVFNDHLEHDRIEKGRAPPRLTGSALKAGRSPEDHLAMMTRLSSQRSEVPRMVARMVDALSPLGIMLGSHDDRDAQDRTQWSALGLRIAEFPVALEAAEAARARGDPIILGSPNIVRGGSHKRGGLRAQDLVEAGLVDALASDYHYPAMADAALGLVDRGVLSLARAWDLISDGPARIMGLSDRGRIEPGYRADFVVFDPSARRIVGTFAEGKPVYAAGRFADTMFKV